MNSKKIGSIILGVTLLGVVAAGVMSSTKIKPGYAGIVYSLNGGIKDKTLSQGLHFVAPWHKVSSYSVATEQAFLSKDNKEGSKDDDSFNIPTSDGKTVNVDLEFSYHFDLDKLTQTFTQFKGRSGEDIENTFIRGKIKAWSSEVTSQFSVMDIYGEKRAELNNAVLEHVKNNFDEYGIVIDSVNFSRISLDEATEKAIQDRINKQQELETSKIEKEKSMIEAERKMIEAKAEAEANREIQKSITPELLKKMEMEARLKHGWIEVQGGQTAVVK